METYLIVIIAVVASIIVLGLLRVYFNGGKNIHTHQNTLSDKIVIITGANTGIGFEACKEMAGMNPAKIILACRSEERALAAMNRIGGTNLEYMNLDLNDMASVKRFAE